METGSCVYKARGGGGPPGGASHHTVGSGGARGAPGAGHVVDGARGGGDHREEQGGCRGLVIGRAPWRSRQSTSTEQLSLHRLRSLHQGDAVSTIEEMPASKPTPHARPRHPRRRHHFQGSSKLQGLARSLENRGPFGGHCCRAKIDSGPVKLQDGTI
jgi:hypothetical protein